MVTFVKGITCHDGICYFNDWLIHEGHCLKDEFICIMVSEGKTENEIDEMWDNLEDKFFDWCENNNVQGETC